MQVPTENTHHRPLLTFTLNIVNTITHILLGGVALGAISFGTLIPISGPFQTHIYLCVTGYVILMAQAVLSLNPYNGWSNVLTHQDKRISHWVLQIVGSVLAIIGSLLRLTDNDILHFRTTHGILGVTAMIMTMISLIGGLLNMCASRLQLNISFSRICHSLFGACVLIVAFITLCLGFNDIYRDVFGNNNANMMIGLTVFAMLGVIISPLMKIFNRVCK